MSAYSTWRKNLQARGLWKDEKKREKYRHELEKLRQSDGKKVKETSAREGKAVKAAVAKVDKAVAQLQDAPGKANKLARMQKVLGDLERHYAEEARLLEVLVSIAQD